jgi:hypothetical protein
MKHVSEAELALAAPTDDLRERFILFLASKPADQGYDWGSIDHCACATFINERLTKRVKCWYSPWGVAQPDKAEADQVWKRWNDMARAAPRTYGGLLQRVRNS